MDFILKSLAVFIGNVMEGMVASILSGVEDMFQALVKTFTTDGLVVSAHDSVLGVSIALISLFCVKQYFNTYVMETSGDPDADPLDILVRGAEAVAVASCSSWIFFSFMNFCSAFADEIVGDADIEDFSKVFTDAVETLTVNITKNGFVGLVFLLSMLIGIFCFYVIATIRALELAMMYIILPLFCGELCYASHERFNGLLTNIVVTGLYFVLQLLMFKLFMTTLLLSLTDITAVTETSDFIMDNNVFKSIGFCIVMLRSPKWMDKFVYNSGVGETVRRGTGAVIGNVSRAFMWRRMGG